tara:strand:- start:833 stop:1582 length:750 start_codon:yes stop_codon:yes gene_type:complete
MNSSLLKYTTRIGDNCLILGQRMSMWCSNGPTLEEDIALANISLDLFGQANGFYLYAEELNKKQTADDLAFKRNAKEFLNYQLVEIENKDFGHTIVRNFLFDTFQFLFYQNLKESKDQTLSDIAHKAIKEVKYHLRHSKNWLLRLGDGTSISNEKVQKSLNIIWQYTGELFEIDEIDKEMIEKGIGIDTTLFKSEWIKTTSDIIKKANLKIPENITMQTGGKKGIHTEHLAPLLTEMQYIPRKYADAKW